MSLKTRAQEDLLRWLIAELLKLYGGEGEEQLEPDVQTLTGPRAYGQGSIGAKGRRFTGRTSNLYRRPGQDLPTIIVEGRPVALGNTGRRRPMRPRRAPGFAFVPYLPPLEDDMPYQPFASLPVIQLGTPYKGGIAPAFAGSSGSFGEPVRPADTLPGGPKPAREFWGMPMLETAWEQYYTAPAEVHDLWRSELYTSGGTPLSALPPTLYYAPVPQERAFASGYDMEVGPHIASWEHHDLLLSPELGNALHVEANHSYTVFSPQHTTEPRPEQPALTRPAMTFSANVSLVAVPDTHRLYAYRFTPNGRVTILEDDLPLSVDVPITVYQLETAPGARPGEADMLYAWDFDGRKLFLIEQLYMDINPGLYSIGSAANRRYGIGAQVSLTFIRYYGESFGNYPPATYIPPPPGEGPTQEEAGYIVYENIIASTQTNHRSPGAYTLPDDEDADPNSFAMSFPYQYSLIPGSPPPDENASPASMARLAREPTAEQIAAHVPFYGVWPETPTEASRAEVARLNRYIYDAPYLEGAGTPFPLMGRLANPAGVQPLMSTWGGLEWTSLEYVCDAFRAPSGELYAVAIVREQNAYTVKVSRDRVVLGEWDLWDFFPTVSPGNRRLTYLSGAQWPPEDSPALVQHYGFSCLSWPGPDVAYLAPFRARLRHTADKLGQQFSEGAADAPISLFFDSIANDFDPAQPANDRDYYPLGFDAVTITSISGVTSEQLTALTAAFDPALKPAVVTTLSSFSVDVDVDAVLLPRRYLVRIYVWVKGSASLTPETYQPTPPDVPQSRLFRLTPNLTGGEVIVEREERSSPIAVPVTLPGAFSVVRVQAEVRGLANQTEPLWGNGGGS